MNGLTYLSWFLGPALEMVLLGVMVRGKLRLTFPRFFAYILFQVLKSGVLFLVYRYSSHENYFDVYWAGNAVSIFLAVTVIDEIWKNLFQRFQGIQDLGSMLFRWACVLMFLIAVVSALPEETNAHRVVSAVLAFDRSMRLMQCGLFFLVLFLCPLLKRFWRHHVFGIALGFGIFATVELVLVGILTRFGTDQIATISLIKSVAYNVIILLWIGYLRRPSPVPQPQAAAGELNTWNLELLAGHGTLAGNDSFLTMVEQAAERVLTRTSPWPRLHRNGSRLVRRNLNPEDRN